MSFTKMLKDRFECNKASHSFKNSIANQELYLKIPLKKALNIILSQILSVNNNPTYLVRLKVIYQFLAKTYVGKCHAIGKPVRSQRTWSNAWTSYNRNNILRIFISQTKKNSKVIQGTSTPNFKVTAKKYGAKLNKYKTKIKPKKINWF